MSLGQRKMDYWGFLVKTFPQGSSRQMYASNKEVTNLRCEKPLLLSSVSDILIYTFNTGRWFRIITELSFPKHFFSYALFNKRPIFKSPRFYSHYVSFQWLSCSWLDWNENDMISFSSSKVSMHHRYLGWWFSAVFYTRYSRHSRLWSEAPLRSYKKNNVCS